MKKAGTILLVIAALSLFGALISAGRDTNTAGGRFMGALILGGIGLILLYFGNRKGDTKYENGYRTTNQNNASSPQESYWQKYKRQNPTKASAIEAITEKNMSSLSEKDVQELVSSIERWATNIGCDIQDIKTEFLQSFKSTFGDDDTKEILERLKNKKLKEEANRFNISAENTCTHFMIKWLTESLQNESAKSASGIKYRNKMSARDLIKRENESLKFIKKPDTEKIFFICGSKKGYVSPAAVKKIDTGSVDDFYYAEVSIDNSNYVPCLMLVNKPDVVRSFDVETDHTTSSGADNNFTGEEMLKKELEIRNRLCALMKTFIQNEYGELKYFHELDDLTIPIANAKTCYDTNESMINICKQYGLNYSDILDKAASIIVEEYISLKSKPEDSLPF